MKWRVLKKLNDDTAPISIETCSGEEVYAYSSSNQVSSPPSSSRELHDETKKGDTTSIIVQALEQLNNGCNRVYISGVSNGRVRAVLLSRPDLFQLHYGKSKAGRQAFDVTLRVTSNDVGRIAGNERGGVEMAPQVCVTQPSSTPSLLCRSTLGSGIDSARNGLLHQVKSFQQASRDHNSTWRQFCDINGHSYNPELVSSDDLHTFFQKVRIRRFKPAVDKQSSPICGSQYQQRPHISLA